MKQRWLALFFLLSGLGWAQSTVVVGAGSGNGVSITTVAGLASVTGMTKGTIAVVTDGNSATDCATGTGSTVVACQYSGSVWSAVSASGTQTWPSSPGVMVCTGTPCTAFGTSITVGTGNNNLVQLNGSAQLPAVSAALLTNIPGQLLSAVGDPGANKAFDMTTRTLNFNFTGDWGSGFGYSITSNASNASTGPLFQLSTGTGTTHDVFQACALGTSNCAKFTSTGSLTTIGTATIDATKLTGALPALNGASLTSINAATLGGATFAAPGTIGGATPGDGHFAAVSATGQITSTLSIGTAPFSITSTTVVPNLNVSQLLGQTWAVPGTIGGTTPGAGHFTTLDATGAISSGTAPAVCGTATGCYGAIEGTAANSVPTASQGAFIFDTSHLIKATLNNGAIFTSLASYATAPLGAGGTGVDLSGSGGAVNTTGKYVCKQDASHVITCAAIVSADLPIQYTKGSCTEAWGGSGTSFALASGDDAISNNTCYNDSGVTRTITAVKCLSDAASNTTTVNPTFGAAGTGTSILTGALTCGNSNAMSATGTLDTGAHIAWTTGAGIAPAMSGTLTGTHIAMIVDYTF